MSIDKTWPVKLCCYSAPDCLKENEAMKSKRNNQCIRIFCNTIRSVQLVSSNRAELPLWMEAGLDETLMAAMKKNRKKVLDLFYCNRRIRRK